jgi:hypothetical protein
MTELRSSHPTAGAGRTIPRPDHGFSPTVLPSDAVPVPVPEPAMTSVAAALGKKHTFDCPQPTRGGTCDC